MNAFLTVLKNDTPSRAKLILMYRASCSLLLLIVVVLSVSATAATIPREHQRLDIQDYDGWYQVEIIVFKPRKPAAGNELWPEEAFSYPPNMVSVSAADNDNITPYSLSQLDSLTSAPEAASESNPDTRPAASGFLFEGRGNHNRALAESSHQSEIIPDDSAMQAGPPVNETEPQDVEPELDFAQADVLLDSALPQAYRALPKETFTLSTIARSLRRSSKYDVAMHKAWIQPVGSNPSPILLQAGDRYDDLFEIDGTLSISRSRYLHVQADLWFTQFEPKYNPSQFMLRQPAQFSERAKGYPELIKAELNRDTHIAVQTFPLHHSRRMRSSALHYIDHPYFGILIKIDKFNYSL